MFYDINQFNNQQVVIDIQLEFNMNIIIACCHISMA